MQTSIVYIIDNMITKITAVRTDVAMRIINVSFITLADGGN